MRLLRSLLTSLLRMIPDRDSATTSKVVVMPRLTVRFDRVTLRPIDPAHECVDRPWLGCPACFAATGNEFATVDSDCQKYSKTG
jgi:hypothetical protein